MNNKFMSDLEEAFREKYGGGIKSFCACKQYDFAIVTCNSALEVVEAEVREIILIAALRSGHQADERIEAKKRQHIYCRGLWINFTIIENESGDNAEIRISLLVPEEDEFGKKVA